MTRTLAWDDENRLLKTTDKSGTNENITTYSYDAGGMRALKKGKYGTVQYVSDNYTVRNKDLISKHVFAGNTRLVSKTVMQEEKSGKMTSTEQGSYYYHADHLGSSSVVTDKDGKFYEQIEYFPYGETWINNKANSEQTSSPYKFTAKEYDEETGLYYYGARYYDAKLSRWCSADPVIDLKNTIDFDVYSFCYNNPIVIIDPDGRLEYDIESKQYTITKGDTINSISKETGVGVQELLDANKNIKNKNEIFEGDHITIPKKTNIIIFENAAQEIVKLSRC